MKILYLLILDLIKKFKFVDSNLLILKLYKLIKILLDYYIT